MPRQLSLQALAYLTEREGGCHLTVYDDGFGYATVGVGHLVLDEDGLELGDDITQKQADDFLQQDLDHFREAVQRAVPIGLTQCQFDALVIFSFNIGVNAFTRSTLARRLKTCEISQRCTIVKEEMPRWKNAGGKFSRGLLNRRIDTVQMFCENDYNVDWSGLEGQQ